MSLQTIDNVNRKAKRQNISERLRFKIFRRDGFICQYCGRVAVEMELSIDHIIPVSKGGTSDFDNLITACLNCNRGKFTENVPEKEIKSYTEETVFIDDPFPQCDTVSFKGIMDFLDIDNAIIHRAILVYKPGEPSIPLKELGDRVRLKKEYQKVEVHSQQIKLGIIFPGFNELIKLGTHTWNGEDFIWSFPIDKQEEVKRILRDNSLKYIEEIKWV